MSHLINLQRSFGMGGGGSVHYLHSADRNNLEDWAEVTGELAEETE